MAIIYKNNLKKDKYNQYSTYLNRERMECRIPRRSIIFISLILCVISLFYISLSNVYHENIVPSTKYIEIVSRKLSETETENNNNNMQRKNTMNPLDETNESSISSKNNKSITLENKPYNDMSKNLTEKELFEVLNSFEECPSNEDLRNIWSHTIGVGKEGFDNILKKLKALIQKYLDNDLYIGCDDNDGEEIYLYGSIWKQNLFSLCGTVAKEEVEYTKNFYSLINDKHTLDDILKFIYSFIEHFNALKKELLVKHQKEILYRIAETLNK